MNRLPILTFHSIDESGSAISMARRDFERLMRQLARRGWRGCTVGAALAAWARGDDGRRFGLCFDDAYRNLLEGALPVLRELGFQASVFVIANRCGRDNRWPGQASWVPPMRLLDWPELETLLDEAWEIGSHGLEHLPLPALEPARVAGELEGARELLETRLGTTVRLLAYPYGAHDEGVREAARRHYEGALGDRLALADRDDLQDPFELPRVDGYYLRRWPGPLTLDAGLGGAYLAARRWLRRLRPRRFDYRPQADSDG